MTDSSSDPPIGDPPASDPPVGDPPSHDQPSVEAASVESPIVAERCSEERYTVRCSMPRDHDGAHQHVPANEGLVLSWKHEPK